MELNLGSSYMTVSKELAAILSGLTDYKEEDWDLLQSEAEQIRSWIPDLVDNFYATLYGMEATKSVFKEGERPKLEKTLEDWVFTLTSGRLGEDFWNHQWFIGLIHVQRGVKNIYMLGIMTRVQKIIFAKCMETYERDRALEIYNAFLGVSGAIAALIAECYDMVMEQSVIEGMTRVGLNPGLIERIKKMQIKKMIEEASSAAAKKKEAETSMA